MLRMAAITIAIIALANTAIADTATEIGKAIGRASSGEASKAVGRTISSAYMESVCSKPETADRMMGTCFMTPSGKRIWELPEGAEKQKWKIIAQERQTQYNRERAAKLRRDNETAKIAADEYKMNETQCRFWNQQEASPRKQEMIKRYC